LYLNSDNIVVQPNSWVGGEFAFEV